MAEIPANLPLAKTETSWVEECETVRVLDASELREPPVLADGEAFDHHGDVRLAANWKILGGDELEFGPGRVIVLGDVHCSALSVRWGVMMSISGSLSAGSVLVANEASLSVGGELDARACYALVHGVVKVTRSSRAKQLAIDTTGQIALKRTTDKPGVAELLGTERYDLDPNDVEASMFRKRSRR